MNYIIFKFPSFLKYQNKIIILLTTSLTLWSLVPLFHQDIEGVGRPPAEVHTSSVGRSATNTLGPPCNCTYSGGTGNKM